MRRRGVTVLEALVGVAIMIVIAAICYPAVRALSGRAQQSNCAEKLHAVGTGLTLYAGDHDGYLPSATTAEWAYRDTKGIPEGDLAASPAKLRDLVKPYVPTDGAWFCPVDPHAKENVLWLGQRHRFTSFLYDPKSGQEEAVWPPHIQLGKNIVTLGKGEEVPLLSDAVGIPANDSDKQFRDEKAPTSNHPDGMVNSLRHDLSLSRHSAKFWIELRQP